METPDGLRNEALAAVARSIEPRLPEGITVEDVIREFGKWDVVPVQDAMGVMGAVLIRGNEIHVGFSRPPNMSVRRYVRGTLHPIIQRYGWAHTSVQTTNSAGLRFCKRLGFVAVAHSAERTILHCSDLIYA